MQQIITAVTSAVYIPQTAILRQLMAMASCMAEWYAGDGSDRRFMAYNALGCIICKEGEEYNIIEVALHDTRAQRRRMPNLNDLYRFSIASLGDRVSCASLPLKHPLVCPSAFHPVLAPPFFPTSLLLTLPTCVASK